MLNTRHHNNISFSWVIWGLAALFYCYEYLLRILPSVMTDYLRGLFMINGLAFGNLAAVYYYAYIPMQLPAGILMDRSSPRKLLMFACLVCGIGTYWFAQPNLMLAYMGRFLVGLGSAFAFVGVMKLATLWFPPSYFSFLTGLTTSLGMMGAMLGNITLARLMNLIGSQQLLMFSVIAGLALTAIMGIIIPEHAPQIPHKARPLRQSTYIAELFILLKDLQMWLLGLIGCCLFLSLTTFAEMWGIPYLMCHYGLSNYTAASYNSLVFLGWAIGGPLMGSIASQFKKSHYRPKFIMGNAILGALCFSTMLYFPQFAKPYLGLLLFSFGLFSAVQVIIFSIVRDFYSSNLLGIAFALTNLLVMLGGGISQPLVGYLLDLFATPSQSHHLITFSSKGFTYAMSAIPCAFILAAALSLFIKNSSARSKTT